MYTSVASWKYIRDLKVVDFLYLFDAIKNCLQFKNITRSVEKSIPKYFKIYKFKYFLFLHPAISLILIYLYFIQFTWVKHVIKSHDESCLDITFLVNN